MKKTMLLLMALFCAGVNAQINLSDSIPVITDFSSMGNSGVATLPTGFRLNNTPNYSTAISAISVTNGKAYGTTGTGAVTAISSGGYVNWANGITASSTDRCLGILSSGSFSIPQYILNAIQNTASANTIKKIDYGWNYEKYRSGATARTLKFFHGSNGSATTIASLTANTAGDQSYADDANNATVFNPPTSISKSVSLTGLSIPPGGLYYIVFEFSSASATNSQGLGIDDQTVKACMSIVMATQPLTTQAVCQGSTPTNLSVVPNTTSTGPFTYQWYKNTTNSTTGGTVISGATTSSYTPSTATIATDYYYCNVAGRCDTVNSTVAQVQVFTPPTITLSTVDKVCYNSTVFTLPYSATSGAPDQYSITTGTSAMAGFTAVTLATLPTSPVSVTIPGAVSSGTYDFNLTVKNSTTGCFSVVMPFTVTVNTSSAVIAPPTSSTSGAIAQCIDATGFAYYATTGAPNDLIFAINKGSSGMAGETVNIEVLGSSPTTTSSAGVNQEHSSFFMKSSWNITCATQPSTPVDIRFFINPSDTVALVAARDAAYTTLKSTNPSSLAVKTAQIEWFKTVGVPYDANWRSGVIGNKFPSAYLKLTPTYGYVGSSFYAQFTVSSFSGGTGGVGFGPPGPSGGVGLPVTWASYRAIKTEQGNYVKFSTASEKNTDYFQVCFSTDANALVWDSTSIPRITAAGNSATLNEYSTLHTGNFSGLVYYYIKQVDLDGKFENTPKFVAKTSDDPAGIGSISSTTPHFYPNPASGMINIVGYANTSVTIIDNLGRIVLSYTKTKAHEMVDISKLSQSVYTVGLVGLQGNKTFHKLVIE